MPGHPSSPDVAELGAGLLDAQAIGIGSLATVYRARETGTNRLVAVKVFDVADTSKAASDAFITVAREFAALNSEPNLVTTYEAFVAPGGRPALVLQLCHGSVAALVQPGTAMPAREAVAIAAHVAGALDAIHRAGVVHRRVTPQNILLDAQGRPLLSDLGEAILQRTGQLGPGLLDFTNLHAAPELLEGGEVTPATDVYALASTIYQVVAGRPAFRPYDGESPASVSLRVLRDPVQPIIAPGVPVGLSDLLQWAMAKDPRRRPPGAAMFGSYLARLQGAEGWLR